MYINISPTWLMVVCIGVILLSIARIRESYMTTKEYIDKVREALRLYHGETTQEELSEIHHRLQVTTVDSIITIACNIAIILIMLRITYSMFI